MEISTIDLKSIFDGKHAQRLLILGSSGSGKSYFMKLLYLANRRRFDELYVVTDSLNNSFYSKFDGGVQLFDDTTGDTMVRVAEGLISSQMSDHLLDTRRDGTYIFDREVMFICDDIISRKAVFSDSWSRVYGTARKASVNIAFLCHSPHSMVSPAMKLSSTYIIIFNLGGSQTAIQWAISTIADKLPTNEYESRKDHLMRARSLYYNLTREKYSAIIIDQNTSTIYSYKG